MAISSVFIIFIAKSKAIMKHIIGRNQELKILKGVFESNKSEFVAVYGRRRVGKTFLIREAFDNKFTFQVSGLANATLSQQLTNFYVALQKANAPKKYPKVNNWLMAFQDLIAYIETSPDTKKVIFIDELPWFDTQNSGFIQALEHFWNSWASARRDIILIVCGSAASWMINKLINNKGGLHNRIRKRLKVVPFTLKECQSLLAVKHSALDYYQIIQLYMVLGGIPYYWDEVSTAMSAMQNIDAICFQENGLLKNEFDNLYRSLFKNYEKYLSIVNALAKKSKGLTRDEIVKESNLANAGSLTRLLDELEESGFIRKYAPFGKKSRNSLYQLVDFYTLFYLKFINGASSDDENNWMTMIDNPKYRAWSGYAFEQVCLYHLPQIKESLGISGIGTNTSSWRSTSTEQGVQIDLVIDRRDQVINLCEMKFSIKEFVIDKKYNQELRNKIGFFKAETGTKKSVFLTMVTTFGILQNSNSIGLIQNEIRMEDLFK